MKLISYLHGGKPGFGIVKGQGIIALGSRTSQPSLKNVLDRMDSIRAYADETPDLRIDEVTYAPPIPNPDKILCIGINYQKHLEETGRDRPKKPMIFTRFANTQVGHGQPMIRPRVSEQLDFEGELAFVIGRKGRHISEADALSHVAGYACYNDGSVRDWQLHTSQFTPGKNFVGTGGFGPWLVTPDEVPEIMRAGLVTRLNGQEVQQTTTDDLIFGIPELIAYCSQFTELVPGDIFSTGTPSGVGAFRKPPLWMKPGDVVEVEIEGIGVLRNPVAAE
jgi:2-keto-4-pentenoate hydratase/2-oxohepta-3-ene-1,7-dioic acid hydratase in catechol pathway